jgi:hypothetical protein
VLRVLLYTRYKVLPLLPQVPSPCSWSSHANNIHNPTSRKKGMALASKYVTLVDGLRIADVVLVQREIEV